jgi:hypothetical protein
MSLSGKIYSNGGLPFYHTEFVHLFNEPGACLKIMSKCPRLG